ncbi:MAG: RNA polymerase sigma factor [Marinoscillum sp.]|uniref:RNA polymerase sigma factor n=1 Tax=Marinoscillum sp. TaxID=2024838 RepID=UPI003300573F
MEDSFIISKIQDPETINYGFNLLVKTYQERVYWHVRKMVIDHDDADDLTQNVFIKIWKSLGNFREEARLYTWIYRIATNECLNFLKKKRRKFMIPIHDVAGELSNKIDQGTYISGDEIQLKLQKAILTLPDKQRLVFNMRYFDELKFDDIAEITGTSVGALKASYHLAAKKIEIFLTEH